MHERDTLIASIRGVLLEEWDPINIDWNRNLRDEYDSYVPEIANLIARKASLSEIEGLLSTIEEQLGVNVTEGQRRATVLALTALPDA